MKLLLTILSGLIILFHGCSDAPDPDIRTFGFRGSIEGRFGFPRAIGVQDGKVFVIDRTGRVQILTLEGEFVHQWFLEKYDNGTPTGISIDEYGHIWIADTHNTRILQYDQSGTLLAMWGDYGEQPGHFIYPTDVEFGDDGNLYIIEYGIQDRVQVFTRTGDYIRHWGDFGDDEQSFSRPMAITKNAEGLLYIADAGNHRIKVYDQQGNLIRLFGSRGDQPGQFNFPYDVDVDTDGNVYVCDYSNHKVHKLTAEGVWLTSWGGLGGEEGQLFNPWGVSVTHDWIYVADARNNRIQAFRSPGIEPVTMYTPSPLDE